MSFFSKTMHLHLVLLGFFSIWGGGGQNKQQILTTEITLHQLWP